MNVKNLKVGQIIKNYKVLCEMLDEKIKGGKSKQLQLKAWENYFSYHKEGYKFIIDKIYKTPKKKNNIKIGNNNKYIDDIEKVLINYLYINKDKSEIILSFSKIINILGFVNNTYTIANNRKKELSDILDINLTAIHYFYNITRSELKKIIERALNNLKRRSVIQYNKVYMIAYNTVDFNDEHVIAYRKATNKEVKQILDIQKSVLEEMEIKDMQKLFLSGIGIYKKFMKLVKEKLPTDWVFYFQAYELIVGEYAIKVELKNILQHKENLNKKSIERMSKCLKIIDKKDNEQILLDSLINLQNYKEELDKDIINLYEQHRDEKINKHYNNAVKLKELQEQKDKIIIDNLKAESEYDDEIEISEYIAYTKDKKDKKEVKDMGYDPNEYNSFEEVMMDILG